MTEPEFTVSDVDYREADPRVHRFIIAVDGKAVLRRQPNGQTFYMTYKTERFASRGLYRVQVALPGAEVCKR